jgi:TPR repeat protein
MAKTRSWSVKGVDGETRDLARDAARAAGMTIGAWIDQAILSAKRGDLPTYPSGVVSRQAEAGSTEAASEPVPPSTGVPASPPPEKRHETLTADPKDRLYPSEQPTPVSTAPPAELPTEGLSNAGDELPAALNEMRADPDSDSGGRPTDREAGTEGSFDAESATPEFSAEPRPLAPPPARPSVLRYALVGLVFAAILGGGGLLFVEFSSPDRALPPPKIADVAPPAEPPIEAPPPPPPASSTTAAVAPAPAAQSAPPSPTAAGTDSSPAQLPDPIQRIIVEARAGNPEAQYNLGMLHLSGRLGEKSAAEAAKWFGRSAEQGIPNAQFNLGVLYQRGEGVPQNDEQAFFWFQSAAEQNYPQAQHNLATAYAEGRGIALSYPKAAEWFAKSAEAGLSQSQFSLGARHERGLITGQPNPSEARRWYERALAQGDTRASERLAALDAAAPPADTAAATTSDAGIGRAEIRQIQTLLSRMNFNPGPADGQMGERTADAIRLYQKFAGMEEDGAPSRELLEDLRAVSESMSKGG